MANPSAEEVEQYQKGQKIQAAYQKIMDSQIPVIDSQFSWLPDWHAEPMPLADRYGTEMNGAIMALSYPPEPPYQVSPNTEQAPPESVLVFADNYGFAQNILKYAPGGRVGRKQIVATPAAQLNQKTDKVLEILKERWDLIIYAYPIDECPTSDAETIHKHQNELTKLLLFIGKAICDDKRYCGRMAVLTCDAFAEEKEIHEEMGMRCVTHTWAFGFCNTARQEMDIPVHYIDVEWSLPETSMPVLAAEVWRTCTFGQSSCAVRILKSGRYVLRLHCGKEAQQKVAKPFIVPENSVIGISGGNGAVACVIGKWIIDQAIKQGRKNVKIEMLSRSMKVSDESVPNWKACQKAAEDAGLKISQEKGDVSNQEKVEEWVAKHTPNVGGFIHSAGVLADTLMGMITWDEFEKVWQPKSRAAMYLHEAFEKYHNPNLSFYWMFSSVSAWGNMGQLNYSSSNSIMDGIARHRTAMGKPGLAIQWGAWGEVGMAANLDENSKRRMAQSPMPPFTNKEGITGTETITQSGYCWGQVQRINGQFLVGMVSGEGHHVQRIFRSTYACLMPPPPSQNMDPENMYMIYKTAQGMLGHKFKMSSGLYFKYHLAPKVCDEEDDDE